MTHVTVLALSINGGIKTLGAYAGLAAVVALALLALLFFSQARELKRLREFIEREAQRQRLAPPVPAPAPAPTVPVVAAPIVPTPTPAPAPTPAPTAAAPVAGAIQATPLVATTVEGVRRVPIPGGGPATESLAPRPPAPADATTISEPPGAEVVPEPSLPPAPQSVPRLIAESVLGQEPGSVHEIGAGVMLGRGKAASIRTTDRLASGRHASVAPDPDGAILIEDLGSTNGTFVNGVQLSAPTTLENGDRIRVGESEFVFENEPLAPPLLPPPPPAPAETVVQDGAPPAAVDPADGDAPPAPDPVVGDAPAAPPAAVPLLAAPVPERTLDLPDESGNDEPVAAVPAPHPDSRGIGPVAPLPPAPIQRRARPPVVDDGAADEPKRRIRRLRRAERRSRAPLRATRWMLLLGVVALAAIAVVVVLLGPSGGGGKATAHKTTPATQAASSPQTTPVAPAPSSVTVAVLNGTTTQGLASTVSLTLIAKGFARGSVADAPSSNVTTTTVGYTTGHRAAAAEVAGALHLGSASVTPVTSANDAAASTGGSAPQIVVTIGANYKT